MPVHIGNLFAPLDRMCWVRSHSRCSLFPTRCTTTARSPIAPRCGTRAQSPRTSITPESPRPVPTRTPHVTTVSRDLGGPVDGPRFAVDGPLCTGDSVCVYCRLTDTRAGCTCSIAARGTGWPLTKSASSCRAPPSPTAALVSPELLVDRKTEDHLTRRG